VDNPAVERRTPLTFFQALENFRGVFPGIGKITLGLVGNAGMEMPRQARHDIKDNSSRDVGEIVKVWNEVESLPNGSEIVAARVQENEPREEVYNLHRIKSDIGSNK